MSADALGKAVAITATIMPLDDTKPEPGFEWDYERLNDEIDALAAYLAEDPESLATRAEKLIDFLRLATNQQYLVMEDGRPVVDATLLTFAASTEMDNSRAPLIWP